MEHAAGAGPQADHDADADARRALRRAFARLGTEASRLILAYHDFGDAAERGQARLARRRQLAARLGLPAARLRARALAVRAELEAQVRAELEDPAGAPPSVIPAADDTDSALDAEVDLERDAADWRAWLLQTLDAPRRAELARRLEHDPLARDALREAETDLHDDYAREQLTVPEHLAFEQQVLSGSAEAACRQRFSRAMKPAAERRRPAAVRAADAARKHARLRFGRLLVGATLAAGMTLTLALNPHWLAPAGPRQASPAANPVRDAAPPTVLLLARTRADAAQPLVTLALSDQAGVLRVQAGVTDADDTRRYRLTVLPEDAAPGAAPLFEAVDLPLRAAGGWRYVEVLLPAAVLLDATRIVRIEAQAPANAYRDAWTVHAPRRTTPDIELPSP